MEVMEEGTYKKKRPKGVTFFGVSAIIVFILMFITVVTDFFDGLRFQEEIKGQEIKGHIT